MIRDRAAGRALAARLGVTKFATRMERCEVADLSDRERNETDGFDTSMDGMFLEGIDEVYGAHLWNYAPAGTIGCLPGAITSNSDSVSLTVRGTGGHASAPQGTVDAIAVAAQLVSALQMVVSRNVAPTESAVLTLGRIEGGFAPNVLANEVKVLGTMRTFTAPVKALMVRRIHQIAMGIAVSHGPACSIDVDIREGYPACVNDARCAKAVLEAAASVLPGQHVGPPMPNMAGEDFTFFLARKAGALFFIGSNPLSGFRTEEWTAADDDDVEVVHGDRRIVHHHTPEFDIHEGALAVGVAAWVALAFHRLGA